MPLREHRVTTNGGLKQTKSGSDPWYLDLEIDPSNLVTVTPAPGSFNILINEGGVPKNLSSADFPAIPSWSDPCDQNLVPSADYSKNLGSTSARWKALYSVRGKFTSGGGVPANNSLMVGKAGTGGKLRALKDSSFALGYTKGAAAAYVYANGYGSIAMGYALTDGKIGTTGKGSFAGGRASIYYNRSPLIKASAFGAFAFGDTNKGGQILASGYGAFAVGSSYYGKISASGRGSFAGGYAGDYGSTISASYAGGLAWGYATGYSINSYGEGAIAMGYAADEDIYANGSGVIQLCHGTNTRTQSVGVGPNGLRLVSSDSPLTPVDGEIWCDGTYVYIRSGGSSVQIS